MAFYTYGQQQGALHTGYPGYAQSHVHAAPTSSFGSHYQQQQQPQRHQTPQQGLASSPTQMDTSGGYLPAFLLGSPAPKSPSRSRGSISTGLTPGVRGIRTTASTSIDRSHLGGEVGGAKLDGKRLGGPPVQGLYDQAKSPARTSTPAADIPGSSSPERRQLSFSAYRTSSQQRSVSGVGRTGTAATTTPGSFTAAGSSSFVGAKPPSPAQMDPFYTQGEELTSEDGYHDCWITVFGFPPATCSYILEQFSQYGTILRHIVASSGNWMHLLYQSRLQAKKALSKNGKVYGNGIMVGVQPCIDKSVIEGYTVSPEEVGVNSAQSTTPLTPLTPGKRPTTIRPLTAAYQASSGPHQVVPSNPNTPQKNSGFFSKALEYVFGW